MGTETNVIGSTTEATILSDEHFSVDGTLIEAWASQKSFRAKDGSDNEGDGGDFRGQKRSNVTHASTTDPKSRLYRKAAGREAKLRYMGHVTMKNRHGLAVAGTVTKADGTAERRASQAMLKAKRRHPGVLRRENVAVPQYRHMPGLTFLGCLIRLLDAHCGTAPSRIAPLRTKHSRNSCGYSDAAFDQEGRLNAFGGAFSKVGAVHE
jgi:hypothetical protein